MNIRAGIGYDVHRLEEGREFWLGGIRIEHKKGLAGHSDADVLIHAICDALLGALALGDIGRHFPDSDPAYKGIDSKILLQRTHEIILEQGWQISNIDSVVCLQQPRISPYIKDMQACMAKILGISHDHISVKATTTEMLGFTGREEGVSARAIVLLLRNAHPKNS